MLQTLSPASAAMIDHDRRINHGACWCDVIGRGCPMIPLITNLTISEHNDIKQLQPRLPCMCSSEVHRQKRSALARLPLQHRELHAHNWRRIAAVGKQPESERAERGVTDLVRDHDLGKGGITSAVQSGRNACARPIARG